MKKRWSEQKKSFASNLYGNKKFLQPLNKVNEAIGHFFISDASRVSYIKQKDHTAVILNAA